MRNKVQKENRETTKCFKFTKHFHGTKFLKMFFMRTIRVMY